MPFCNILGHLLICTEVVTVVGVWKILPEPPIDGTIFLHLLMNIQIFNLQFRT